MAEEVIVVKNLYKKFTRSLRRSLFYGTKDLISSVLGRPNGTESLRKGEFWSLEDINFTVEKGEAFGIIGANGSGKTTLLRLLSGIFPPNRGSIMVKGKVGSLIALSAGFHPYMSGRENIYVNGTILGMSREEVDSKIDDIIAFADIGEFIDAPVASYSSGMNVRLGFAIAIHSEPEIIFADEALAVGDLNFSLKCYRKIGEFRERGGTLILVSHSISLIRNTCTKTLWLDKGKPVKYGPTAEVCDEFEKSILSETLLSESQSFGTVINNDPAVRITGIEINGQTKSFVVDSGQELKLRINYDLARPVENAIMSVTMTNAENIAVVTQFTNYDGFKMEKLSGKGYVEQKISKFNLKQGIYRISLTFASGNDINNVLEWHDRVYTLLVNPAKKTVLGLFDIHPEWSQGKD